ncbi:hypothetical protein DSM112329_04838 [Paraconexibacter sp. AEG42_29]|uniref:Uncharacterized protein n=1 Tax=Paraconexibacter sp. AEG42_29 TaxID=2997339 RepID=A0AAU7B1Y9_9ACTN
MPIEKTKWPPVLAVLVLAPWFAEMSWGGYPLTDIPVILLFVGPLYGGAALLIREVARRTGRGWPTIVLLGAAFGVLQAGLVDQSLFNPAYDRYDFQHPVHVDGLDISLYYLLAFVAGHVVASIVAPIAVAECWSRRGSEPWLTRRSRSWVAGVYVLATVINHFGVKDEVGHGFQAEPVQMAAAAAAVAVLVVAALRWRPRPATDVRVPGPLVVAGLGFGAYLLYLPGENAAALVFGVFVLLLAVVVLGTWSRSRRWTADHTVALIAGSVLVGVVVPFWSEPYDDSVGAAQELAADVAAATVCLVIVVSTAYRRRSLRSGASAAPTRRALPRPG